MERYKGSLLLLVGSISLFAAGASGNTVAVGSEISNEPAGRWQGPEGNLLPFIADQEVLEFLRTARIVSAKRLSMGKNGSLKVRMEKGGIEANAIFRTVNVSRTFINIDGKTYIDFYDRYIHECAAYELSQLLGLDRVPPCVPRAYDGKEGTLQLWIENAKTLKHLLDDGSAGTTDRSRVRQQQTMRVFDGLIYNFDRNQGNMLFDAAGKLWFIDHTRSFLPTTNVEGLDRIVWCERNMWEKLRNLDRDIIKDRLSSYLNYRQLISILKRRDKLVDHLEKLIDERGEEAVLFEEPGVSNGKIMTREMQTGLRSSPSHLY